MRRKVVTLYIDDTSIRLLVTEGKRVKKWADLPLEPGLIEGAVVAKEAELADRIKRLLKDQNVRAGKIILGLSGLHCFTRPVTLPQLPKAVLPDAVMRVVETALPLPFDQLYISWQTIPSPAGQTQVFLTAVRRKAADAMIKMLGRIGLRPYMIDIKPLALARLVSERTAVIVDVQAMEFDIVIMVDGIPQPVRTVAFPREALSWEERFPLIKNDLDRTIKFYNSNNPSKPLAMTAPTFVSGELVYRPELCASLSRELGHPISVLSSPLGSGQVDLSRHMVNIGLALKHPSLAKNAGSSVATLNLLPAPYRPKPISLIKVAAVPALVVILALIVPMVIMIQGASASLDSVRQELDSTNKVIIQKQAQSKQLKEAIAELEKKIDQAAQKRDAFALALGSFEVRHDALEADLRVSTEPKLDSVRLLSLVHSSENVTINGISQDQSGVLSYARYLDASGRFSEVTVAAMNQNQDGSIAFNLVLKMKGV